jgi:hypothetical protein
MSSNRVYRPFLTLNAWIETHLGRNVPDAQVGTQSSTHSKPTPNDRAAAQSFHRIRPGLPDLNARLDTPGPPMRNLRQHPNDIVAGRTTKFELASIRKRRGGKLAPSEVAAPPHTTTPIAAKNSAAFRIPRS